MHGAANQGVGADDEAHGFGGQSGFAQLHAIRIGGGGYVGALVHQQAGVGRHNLPQPGRQSQQGAAGQFLVAELHQVNAAGDGSGNLRRQLLRGADAPVGYEAEAGVGQGCRHNSNDDAGPAPAQGLWAAGARG